VYVAQDGFQLLNLNEPGTQRSINLLKFGNKMPLKKLKNLRLSLRRGP
jgi:hypothetical protein